MDYAEELDFVLVLFNHEMRHNQDPGSSTNGGPPPIRSAIKHAGMHSAEVIFHQIPEPPDCSPETCKNILELNARMLKFIGKDCFIPRPKGRYSIDNSFLDIICKFMNSLNLQLHILIPPT